MAPSQKKIQWNRLWYKLQGRLPGMILVFLLALAGPGCTPPVPEATTVGLSAAVEPSASPPAPSPSTPTAEKIRSIKQTPGATPSSDPPTASPTPREIPPSPTPAFPGKLIQLAWFYKPPFNGDLQTLANFFDLFILTKKDEPARDTLRASGVRAPILQYLLLTEIQNPGSCSRDPYGNQVAYLDGDFCHLRQYHPDWFLIDRNGKPIIEGKTAYMDPGNPDYRSFWLERARHTQEELGWEGVFIDNIEASLSELHRLGVLPAGYANTASGESDYTAAVAKFLEYLSLNYFHPQGRPMWGNIIAVKNVDVFYRYLNFLDGVMIESFAVDWTDGYRTPEEWDNQLSMAERAQDLGKSVILVAQGHKLDKNRQLFALASYLLVNQGRAYFRYSDAELYDEPWIYDNYGIDLGTPLGKRYKNGTSYQRDFTKGTVVVDPVHHTAKIDVKE